MDLASTFSAAIKLLRRLIEGVAFMLDQLDRQHLAVCQWAVLQDLEQQIPVLH